MNRSSVRSAGLAILLTVNGCGGLSSSTSGTAMKSLNVAQSALDGGAGQIALQVSDEVLHSSPNNIRAMEIKGDALALLGAYDDATAIYAALLAKDPNSTHANIGLGRIRLGKDPAAAEALFLKVLQRDPRDMTALNNLGIARDLQGRHAEAQTAYRQALAINPDLDSAEVNLSLSMAMSGQGAAAVGLLKARASAPGASAKVKQNYAAVLAMSGNRKEAERVLSSEMSSDEIRQVLDAVTGTHTRPAPDSSTVTLASRQLPDEGAPPDVLQVPENSPRPVPVSMLGPLPVPAATPAIMAAAATRAPAPAIVHPQAVADPDGDSPTMQPVNPVAAAVSNQRSLSLPLGSASYAGAAQASDAAAEAPAITPAVVVMPTPPPVQNPASVTVSGSDAAQLPLPEAPPTPPVLRPAPLPPFYQPVQAMASPPPPLPRPAPVPPAYQPAPQAYQPVPAAIPVASPPPLLRRPAPMPAASQAAQVEAPVAPPAAAPRSVPTDDMAATTGAAPAEAQLVPAPKPEAVGILPVALTRAAAPPDPAPKPAPGRQAELTPPAETGVTTTSRTRTGGHDEQPMVQFAATSSVEAANSFWQSLLHRFPDMLGQREPVVVRFEHGGTVFWRVRAEGFGTTAEAQSLCARMRAGGQDCFVTRS